MYPVPALAADATAEARDLAEIAAELNRLNEEPPAPPPALTPAQRLLARARAKAAATAATAAAAAAAATVAAATAASVAEDDDEDEDDFAERSAKRKRSGAVNQDEMASAMKRHKVCNTAHTLSLFSHVSHWRVGIASNHSAPLPLCYYARPHNSFSAHSRRPRPPNLPADGGTTCFH